LIDQNEKAYKKLLNIGKREHFAACGLAEQNSLEFLHAANDGDLVKVKTLKRTVYIDVCDCRGYTALVLAVVCLVYVLNIINHFALI
jgi:hypothetical protein